MSRTPARTASRQRSFDGVATSTTGISARWSRSATAATWMARSRGTSSPMHTTDAVSAPTSRDDALGVERLAVAPRLEVHRTIGAGHRPDLVDQLVALGDEGDGHRATAGS